MTKIVDAALRISAQMAFLGRIHDCMRLIKINESDNVILLSVVVSGDPDQEVVDDISEAAAEIVADFSDKKISEKLEVSTVDIPRENILQAGWIFRRAERQTDGAVSG